MNVISLNSPIIDFCFYNFRNPALPARNVVLLTKMSHSGHPSSSFSKTWRLSTREFFRTSF